MVGQFWGEVFPISRVDGAKAGKLINSRFHFLAEFVVAFRAAGKSDDGVVGGKGTFVLEAEKGRDELASGEIAAGAEDDHNERREYAGWRGNGLWGRNDRVHG